MITELPVTTVTADAIKQELINQIRGYFPDWTDTQASNNMIMFLETLSALSELEYGYVNRLARECFIQFALDPRNVYAHAQGMGYIPKFQTSSVVSAIVLSSSPIVADSLVPAGTQFACIFDGVVHETLADVIIRAGQTQSTPVMLSQKQSWMDSFVGSNTPNQIFLLNQNPVIPGNVTVVIDGITWNYVRNFVDSQSTDPVYTWYEDGNGIFSLIFGNGICGKKPGLGAVIQVTYQTGGGSANAIPANGLTSCISNVQDAGTHALLSLSAYNPLAAIPGRDVETLAQIKAHAIDNLIAPAVLLTRLDVENAVNSLSGVQLCAAVNWETLPYLTRNVVQVFVMPIGGGVASPDLLTNVLYFLQTTKQMVMGVTAYAYPMTYLTLNFTIQLTTLKGFVPGAVQNAIIQTMISMFDPTQSTTTFKPTPGMGVFMSQIVAILQQIPGVQSLTFILPGDTQLSPVQFPLLGTINFV